MTFAVIAEISRPFFTGSLPSLYGVHRTSYTLLMLLSFFFFFFLKIPDATENLQPLLLKLQRLQLQL